MRASEMTSTAGKGRQRIRRQGPQNGGFTVNDPLTARTPREVSDVAQGVARMIRGIARRAEGGDLQALAELRKLDQVLALETLRAAHALNTQHDYSWAAIGIAAGLTKQGAHQRWGR